jgi:hypothetical protein
MSATSWKWSDDPYRKAPVVDLTDDRLTAERKPGGQNPAAFTTTPLTKQNPNFRIKVDSLGNWVGIGVAEFPELYYIVDGSTPLGTQIYGVNSSFFWQDTGLRKIQMYAEEQKDVFQVISVGDIIDVKVDFDANRIYYWKNDQLVGYVTASKRKLREGELFPGAAFSVGTRLSFVNDETPKLDLSSVEEELKDEPFTVPDKPFPTQWKWGVSQDKKSNHIDVDSTFLVATRISGGHNPGIRAAAPFTRNSWYFAVKVKTLGPWFGVGLADKSYILNGGNPLGSQTSGINSSYFWQDTGINRLQMPGEEKEYDAAVIRQGDTVSVAVDFDSQTVYYYLNGKLQGSIKCENTTLEEGKIFPAVNLSSGTEVVILNVDEDPKLAREMKKVESSSSKSLLKKKSKGPWTRSDVTAFTLGSLLPPLSLLARS